MADATPTLRITRWDLFPVSSVDAEHPDLATWGQCTLRARLQARERFITPFVTLPDLSRSFVDADGGQVVQRDYQLRDGTVLRSEIHSGAETRGTVVLLDGKPGAADRACVLFDGVLLRNIGLAELHRFVNRVLVGSYGRDRFAAHEPEQWDALRARVRQVRQAMLLRSAWSHLAKAEALKCRDAMLRGDSQGALQHARRSARAEEHAAGCDELARGRLHAQPEPAANDTPEGGGYVH